MKISPFDVLRRLVPGRTGSQPAKAFRQQQVDDAAVLVDQSHDELMLRAAWEAHKTLPDFLEALAHPKPGTSRYSVKVALKDVRIREFVWVSDLTVRNGLRHGLLASEPRVVKGYRKGQAIQVPLREIFDWMYVDNGAMKGNYTAAVLLASRPAKERADFERANNWTPPDWTSRL